MRKYSEKVMEQEWIVYGGRVMVFTVDSLRWTGYGLQWTVYGGRTQWTVYNSV